MPSRASAPALMMSRCASIGGGVPAGGGSGGGGAGGDAGGSPTRRPLPPPPPQAARLVARVAAMAIASSDRATPPGERWTHPCIAFSPRNGAGVPPLRAVLYRNPASLSPAAPRSAGAARAGVPIIGLQFPRGTYMSDIVIVAAKRTATGSFLGQFNGVPTPTLGAAAIGAALEQSGVPAADVSEVIMGCVLPANLGQAPARQAALAAGLPTSAGCTTINKVCGSGMKAIMLGHDLIKAGSASVVVAGGMESMSNAPHMIPNSRTGNRYGGFQA